MQYIVSSVPSTSFTPSTTNNERFSQGSRITMEPKEYRISPQITVTSITYMTNEVHMPTATLINPLIVLVKSKLLVFYTIYGYSV